MSSNGQRRGRALAITAPTIKQVAAHAGVSTATVSRVLAGAQGVRAELGERVHAAVRALDYHPNRVARNLRVRATRTVGVMISDIQNPFFTSVVRGIEDLLQVAGYTLLLCNTDEDGARERLYFQTLRAEGVAGVIFAPSSGDAETYRALKGKLALVAIDRAPDGLAVDTVAVANTDGARIAVEHLLALGHRRVGFVGGPVQLTTARDRLRGYEQALAAGGLPCCDELVRHADFRQQGGYRAMLDLLDQPAPPSAVFAANNLMTLGTLQALHERGLRIPNDMAVIGFDDMSWAPSLQPPLTAVAQPTYELGATAARLLLARFAEPDRAPERVVLDTRLMVRASCGAETTDQTNSQGDR